jgi:hypothetical protein
MAPPADSNGSPGTCGPDDVSRERDRIAAELQNEVIQRVFAIGLKLQGTAAMANDPAVRRRVQGAVNDLDHVIRIIRDTVFSFETRMKERGLRAGILHLTSALSPVPDVTYRGPVEGSLHSAAGAALLDLLAAAVSDIGGRWVPVRIDVTAGDGAHVTTLQAALRPDASAAQSDDEFRSLRAGASEAGIRIEIERDPERVQISWHAA